MKNAIYILVVLAAIPCPARTITVDDGNPADFNNIQAAINDAIAGDVVEIQPGTYTGDGNRDIDFLGKPITVTGTDPNDPNIVAQTIVDCNGARYDFHRAFRFDSGEDRDSVLEGLTVINGSAKKQVNADQSGDNYEISPGGAIYCEDTSPTIRRCVIADNAAHTDGRGGGFYSYQGNPRIEYCVFKGNLSDDLWYGGYGGAIFARLSNIEIFNCLIYDNDNDSIYRGGAGAYFWGGNVMIDNSTIVNNRGIGICANTYGTGRIRGSIVWGNAGETQIEGAYSLVVSHCNVQGGWPGDRNIDVDPRFVDADANDYHLSSYSHCINAGDPCYIDAPGEEDMDGERRIMDGLIDIGADERPAVSPVLNLDPLIMNVDAVFGENPADGMLAVRNTGVGTLNWQITENCSWLSVELASGTSTGETHYIVVSIDVAGLDIGTYECEITVEDNNSAGSPQIVPVILNIFKEILHVPGDTDTIQGAVDYVTAGGTVIVAPGTYTGDGNRDIDFKGKAITVCSADPNDPAIVAATVIDCNGSEFDPHRAFYVHDNPHDHSVIAGLTIINGWIWGRDELGGGGIYSDLSTLTIRNCTMQNNAILPFCPPTAGCHGEGSAILCMRSNVIVSGCTIVENFGLSAVTLTDSNAVVTDCSLTANYACAIYPEESSLQIKNCLIVGNSNYEDSTAGIGGWSNNSQLIIANSTISDNFGIGIESQTVTLTNSIVSGNNRQLAVNTATSVVTFSNIEGGWPGEGNIDADPCFVTPGHWEDPCNTPEWSWDDIWIHGDYYLKSQAGRWDPNSEAWVIDEVTSLCIDAGNPMDPIGHEPFPNGGMINMGAYGGTEEASKSYFGEPPCETIMAGDIDGDCQINFADFRLMALHWCESLP